MRKTLMQCPEDGCDAGPDLQVGLTQDLYAKIPASDQKKIESRTENGIIDIPKMRCRKCGCVYGKWPVRNHVFGWLDVDTGETQWVASDDI